MKVSLVSRNICIGLATLALSLAFCLSPWGTAIDLLIYDCFFYAKGQEKVSEDIVIVTIDEPSLAIVGKQWPWPRSIHAALIENLFAAGARAVALDLLFSEPSFPLEDQQLAQALENHPYTVLAMVIDTQEDEHALRKMLVTPYPDLVRSDTTTGFSNIPVDPDGFIRTALLWQDTSFSLAWQAVCQFLGKQLPPMNHNNFLINYYGPQGTIPAVSYYQALESSTHLAADFFQGKLVMIGFSTLAKTSLEDKMTDYFPVPFSRWQGGLMSGIEIHATIAANLLTGTHLRQLDKFLVLLLAVPLGLIALFAFFSLRPLAGGLLLTVTVTVIAAVSFLFFKKYGLYVSPVLFCIPLATCYLTSPFIHYWQTWKEKRFIRNAFSTYVPPSVVAQLVKNPQKLVLGGENVEITAFFSDVQGFTAISEKLSPRELVALLNEFLSEMTDIILAHGGTVDKFEGDAIIAFWGAPVAMPNHAEQAALAAIAMQKRLGQLRQAWAKTGAPLLKMRIGLCSGKAVVGNMGSVNRMDYTMMGDTVNTAARLEGVNKVYGIYTLMSESTQRMLHKTFLTRKIDRVLVIGKKEPVAIFELIGNKEDVDSPWRQACDMYSKGLEAYGAMDWQAAIAFFEKTLAILPGDGPSNCMIKRCQQFMHDPPAADWLGVYRLTQK